MRKNLTIIAKIVIKPNQIELVKSELLKLIEPTLKEAGCIQYDLHQDNDNPSVFLFYETWQSRELWQEHMKSSHLADHAKATEGAVESVTINEMTMLLKPFR